MNICGHMEKQEMGDEMETRVAMFSSQTHESVPCHYSCILLSNDYMTLPLLLLCAL